MSSARWNWSSPMAYRTDTDFGAPVNRLKGAGSTVVLLVGLPNSTGGIMGTAEQIAFTPQWIGVSPTWLSLLSGNAYMQEHFTLVAEGPEAGDTESDSEARARSSTRVTGADASRSACCSSASGVTKTSTTHSATPRAPSTAFGPSARKSRRSVRTERRLNLRASLTRAFPTVSGVLMGGFRRRPWAR